MYAHVTMFWPVAPTDGGHVSLPACPPHSSGAPAAFLRSMPSGPVLAAAAQSQPSAPPRSGVVVRLQPSDRRWQMARPDDRTAAGAPPRGPPLTTRQVRARGLQSSWPDDMVDRNEGGLAGQLDRLCKELLRGPCAAHARMRSSRAPHV